MDNNFPELPTLGLRTVEHLSIRGNTALTKFPSRRRLPKIKVLELQYPYHCCSFLNQKIYYNDTSYVSTLQYNIANINYIFSAKFL